MRDRRSLLLVIAVVAAVALAFWPASPGSARVTFLTNQGTVQVPVEVADSPEERQVGLMFRSGLEGGMLFIFERDQPLSFWMKNTRIPLDIIFINSSLQVVSIQEAVPCDADPCPPYPSAAPARYVVEVNAGFAGAQGVQAGDHIRIEGVALP
ncbi:MAG: DUF192 domain-containing protein [Candidatus Aenigmarchaeota archaeon]|nr:DUF192 domain-containing protein [Candidatus Aenigmarchaeota archaeon]